MQQYFEVHNLQNITNFSTIADGDMTLNAGFHWLISPVPVQVWGQGVMLRGTNIKFYLDDMQRVRIRQIGGFSSAAYFWVTVFSQGQPFNELPAIPFTVEPDTPVTWQNSATVAVTPTIQGGESQNLFLTECHMIRGDTNDRTTAVNISECITRVEIQDSNNQEIDTLGLRRQAESDSWIWARCGFFWKAAGPQEYVLYPRDGRLLVNGQVNAAAQYLFYFLKFLVV